MQRSEIKERVWPVLCSLAISGGGLDDAKRVAEASSNRLVATHGLALVTE